MPNCDMYYVSFEALFVGNIDIFIYCILFVNAVLLVDLSQHIRKKISCISLA